MNYCFGKPPYRQGRNRLHRAVFLTAIRWNDYRHWLAAGMTLYTGWFDARMTVAGISVHAGTRPTLAGFPTLDLPGMGTNEMGTSSK